MSLIFAGGLMFFAWILIKVWKKITAYSRKEDFIFTIFQNILQQCVIGYDSKLKRRMKRYLWIFWNRKPVFMENEKGKLELIGKYHGETTKKEGFYMLAVMNKVSLFKTIEQIIVIPLNIKDKIVKKIDIDKKRTIIIRGEGLDTYGIVDYFLMPLIKDEKKKGEFLDFSNLVYKHLIEPQTYQNIISENLMSNRKNIIKSVESNPLVHFGRRVEKK